MLKRPGSLTVWLLVIVVASIAPRLAFWAAAQHPGLWDPLEYYNLGVNINKGKGFSLDYIWSFANRPEEVTHPLDHWLPLSGVLVATSFAILGVSVQAALLPFICLGIVQVLLAYFFARKIGVSPAASRFAALATSYIPWLFLSSLRTDTTIPFGVFSFVCLMAVYLAVKEDGRWLWAAGASAGLGILTRNDGFMLVMAAGLGSACLLLIDKQRRLTWLNILGFAVSLLLVVMPWLIRNKMVLDTFWPGSTMNAMFVTEHEDFYAYSKDISLKSYMAQGLPHIVGKILFEMAAGVKIMLTMPELFFAIVVLSVLLKIIGIARSERNLKARLLALGSQLGPFIPALLFILLTYLTYTILFPYLSQGGSFKKAYLAAVPFLIILGAKTVEAHVQPPRTFYLVSSVTCLLMLMNAVELTRADFILNRSQLMMYQAVGEALDTLQEQEDREIIVMTRDPWSVNFVTGYRAVMVPNEPLDVILEAADQYGVTHILAPVPRPAISNLDYGQDEHPRIQRVMELPEYGLWIYRIAPVEEVSRRGN